MDWVAVAAIALLTINLAVTLCTNRRVAGLEAEIDNARAAYETSLARLKGANHVHSRRKSER